MGNSSKHHFISDYWWFIRFRRKGGHARPRFSPVGEGFRARCRQCLGAFWSTRWSLAKKRSNKWGWDKEELEMNGPNLARLAWNHISVRILKFNQHISRSIRPISSNSPHFNGLWVPHWWPIQETPRLNGRNDGFRLRFYLTSQSNDWYILSMSSLGQFTTFVRELGCVGVKSVFFPNSM